METNKTTDYWVRPAQEFDKELAMMMLPTMIEALKPQIKQAITESIEDTDRETKGSSLLGATLANIETEGSTSLVTLEHQDTRQKIRFKMVKSPDRYWKIVELDLESFQALSQN
jgi:hypothetical protein